jgi:hypothetical protein
MADTAAAPVGMAISHHCVIRFLLRRVRRLSTARHQMGLGAPASKEEAHDRDARKTDTDATAAPATTTTSAGTMEQPRLGSARSADRPVRATGGSAAGTSRPDADSGAAGVHRPVRVVACRRHLALSRAGTTRPPRLAVHSLGAAVV